MRNKNNVLLLKANKKKHLCSSFIQENNKLSKILNDSYYNNNNLINNKSKKFSQKLYNFINRQNGINKINLNNSVNSNSLSNFFLIKPKNFKKKMFNIKKESNNIMENYKYSFDYDYYNNKSKDDISYLFKDDKNKNQYLTERNHIKKLITKRNKSYNDLFFKNYNKSFNNNNINKITFNLHNENFQNSIQSYNIIMKNKMIYEDMNINYRNFLFENYNNSLNNLNPIIKQNEILKIKKISIPKIQINNIISFENTKNKKNSFDNNNLISNNNFNDNNNSNIIKLKISSKKNNNLEFPESRQQFSLINSEDNNKIFLIGGLTINKSNTIWELNPLNFTWKKIKNNNNPPSSRFGHSTIIHNNKIIIFGGKKIASQNFGNIEIFNLINLNWKKIKFDETCFIDNNNNNNNNILMKNNNTNNINNLIKKINYRKNHIAIKVGTSVFIYGGFDEKGNLLNDSFILDLISKNWMKPHFKNKNFSLPKIAYHKSCLVLYNKIQMNFKFDIYNLNYDISKFKNKNFIKEIGIYIFGGIINKNLDNTNKNNNNYNNIYDNNNSYLINDELFCIKIGNYPLEIIKLKTFGKGPCCRFSSSINYYEDGNFIVIFGGKTNKINSIDKKIYCLNDTFLLNLSNLNWIKVEYCNKNNINVEGRFLHESVIFENKLIIFGGMNDNNFIGSEILIIYLENKKMSEKKKKIRILK